MSVARNFIRLAGGAVLGLATLFVVASAQSSGQKLWPGSDRSFPIISITRYGEPGASGCLGLPTIRMTPFSVIGQLA